VKEMAGNISIDHPRVLTQIHVNSRGCTGRRNPTNWTYTSVPTATNTRHGFTGHEHLDKFALINMNGRVYDPVIGRFLSPDPVLQDPANAQNYNKYSYVLNNPLKYTDPSGYISEEWSYWQKANWFFMQSNSWSRYFHNTGLSEEMARECMGNKMASLFLSIFCMEGTGAGGGGGTTGGSGAPGGQSGASQSGGEGNGEGDYTSGAGMIDDGGDPEMHYPNMYNKKTLLVFETAEERQQWNNMWFSMLKDDYTYLDHYLYSEIVGDDAGDYFSMGVVGCVSKLFGALMIFREVEYFYRDYNYDTYGMKMGVFLKVRMVYGMPVTDVYWGYNGQLWYTYNGILY